MRITAVVASLVLIVIFSSCYPSRVGMSYTATYGPDSYYYDVCQYYHVPEQDVVILRERNIADEEIPVVFFIAQRANVAPATIIDMRARGTSWIDISMHFGIGPDVYYVPVAEAPGPAYEGAYSYYRTKPRGEWNTIRLSDADVVNFVNLRFVSEHHGYDAPEIMKMRSQGKTFMKINEEVHDRRHGRGEGKKQGRD
jgi:hypothetical protein